MDVDVTNGGSTHRLSLPNLHGALVLKAEAHRHDARDPNRHLQDGIVLLACVDDERPILAGLRGSDRTRLTHLVAQLRQDRRPWLSVDRDVADLAEAALAALESGLGAIARSQGIDLDRPPSTPEIR